MVVGGAHFIRKHSFSISNKFDKYPFRRWVLRVSAIRATLSILLWMNCVFPEQNANLGMSAYAVIEISRRGSLF